MIPFGSHKKSRLCAQNIICILWEDEINLEQNKKFSDLKIDVDDYLILVGNSKSTKTIKISLNYFTKDSTRTIIIDGKNISIKADLVNNKMIIHENGKISS